MAKSFVKTNRKELDKFLRAGGQLEDLEIRVGQLTGKPKYPQGHVGKKSRDNRGQTPKRRISRKELDRRQLIRAGRAQLEGLDKDTRKAKLKELRTLFKRAGLSSRTLARRKGARTAVAKVAGVLHAGSAFHVNAIAARRSQIQSEAEFIIDQVRRGRSPARAIQAMGRNSKEAIRRNIRAEGHVDTGKMLRNTQFEIRSMSGFARFKANAKANRQLRKIAKRRQKRGRR